MLEASLYCRICNMDVEKKTEGEALKVIEIFPARALFVLLLILISSVSCHKKNCVVLETNSIPEQIEFSEHTKLLILGSISLNDDKCFSVSVNNLGTGLYVLGILAYPDSNGWKPSDSWNNFKLKMTVMDTRDRKLVGAKFNLLRLYQYCFRQTPYNKKLADERIFLGHGEFYPQCGREPWINWKSTSITTRISSEPPSNEEEDYFREYPLSWFEASTTETYRICIEIKGGCPESFNPQAQIGLMGLN